MKKKATKKTKKPRIPVEAPTFESELRDLLAKYNKGITCEIKANPVFFNVGERAA